MGTARWRGERGVRSPEEAPRRRAEGTGILCGARSLERVAGGRSGGQKRRLRNRVQGLLNSTGRVKEELA